MLLCFVLGPVPIVNQSAIMRKSERWDEVCKYVLWKYYVQQERVSVKDVKCTLLHLCFVVSGAYGTAVLYRKKDDDSLVVLKEISILDLSAAERQASMNEVTKYT